MDAKTVVAFIIGTLFGWVILYVLAGVLGIAIGTLITTAWFVIPALLVILLVWLIYRTIVGNVYYSKNKKE